MDKEIEDQIRYGRNPPKESTPPVPPTKERAISTKSIDEKREELEILRLDNEIKRLSKPDIPDTNYFKEMLAQQQQHFNQLLEMNTRQNDLKLEIEKLKLGNDLPEPDNTLEYLQMLKPLLPAIVAGIGKKQPVQASKAASPPETKEGKAMDIKTAADLEAYCLKIRSGEITEEQAYKDFKEQVPPIIFKSWSKKKFHEKYEEIKAGKNTF